MLLRQEPNTEDVYVEVMDLYFSRLWRYIPSFCGDIVVCGWQVHRSCSVSEGCNRIQPKIRIYYYTKRKIFFDMKHNINATILLDIILNSVRQHNYFITQGNYIGYMFRLLISHLQAYFVNWVTRCYAHLRIPSCLRSWKYINVTPLRQWFNFYVFPWT